jgi:hypothetical protein
MKLVRHYLIGLAAWNTCVFGFLLASIAWTGTHIWSKNDLIWIVEVMVCGMVVVAIIAMLSSRLGKGGGTIAGVICGLMPSAFAFSWALLVRPGFESSAGSAAFAFMLAAPSAIGGGVAGFFCSRRTDKHGRV